MVCTRTTRTNPRPTPIAVRPTTPIKVCLGVESDKDPLFNGGLGGSPLGKTAARILNNKRLKKALIEAAVPRPELQQRRGYRVASVDMCIAESRNTKTSNIGRWFQKEQNINDKTGAYYPRFLSTMDPAILAADPIARWLIIRDELLPTPRGPKRSSLPSISPPIPRKPRIDSSSRVVRLRSPSTLPPSSPPPPSSLPVATSPVNSTPPALFSNMVATILVWTKDGAAPVDLIVHSREDGRIRLSDYKVELGQLECEQMNNLELYHIDSRCWIPFPTDTPLRLNHAGEMIFFKYAHVKYPDRFISRLRVEHGFGFEPKDEDDDEPEDHSDNDLVSDSPGEWPPSPLAGKGGY